MLTEPCSSLQLWAQFPSSKSSLCGHDERKEESGWDCGHHVHRFGTSWQGRGPSHDDSLQQGSWRRIYGSWLKLIITYWDFWGSTTIFENHQLKEDFSKYPAPCPFNQPLGQLGPLVPRHAKSRWPLLTTTRSGWSACSKPKKVSALDSGRSTGHAQPGFRYFQCLAVRWIYSTLPHYPLKHAKTYTCVYIYI